MGNCLTFSGYEDPALQDQGAHQIVCDLTRAAIYHGMYLRKVYSAKYFQSVTLHGVTTIKYRRTTANHNFCMGMKEGIADALKKGYAKSIEYYIYTEPDTKLEALTFNFEYAKDGGISMEMASKADSQKIFQGPKEGKAKAQFKTIITSLEDFISCLNPLPNNAKMHVVMRMTPSAPATYLAPYFVWSTRKDKIKESHISLDVGAMLTDEHHVSVALDSVLTGKKGKAV